MTRSAPLVLLLVLGSCVVAHEVGQVVADDGDASNSVTTGFTGTGGESEGGEVTTSTTGTTTGATTVSATGTDGEVTTVSDGTFGESSDVSTGAADPYAACGVELELGGPTATWRCQCETCDLVQNDLTEQSRDDFLAACVCLCEASGCGGSTTNSETSGAESDSSGATDTATSTTATTSDTGSSSG